MYIDKLGKKPTKVSVIYSHGYLLVGMDKISNRHDVQTNIKPDTGYPAILTECNMAGYMMKKRQYI